MEVKLQACCINCNKAILIVVLLVLITFMFKPLCCNTSTIFNFFILLFMEIFVPNKYKGSRAIEADTITRSCFYGVKFNFPWNFRTDTKMLSGIKFCPTASFASASQLKKQTVFCEVVHVVRSCTYFLVPVLHAGYVRYYTALSQSKLNLSKIVFDSLNVHLYLV